MSDSRNERVEELFQRVIDLPPEERAEFLGRECPADHSLRQEVEILLHHANEARTDFLAGRTTHDTSTPTEAADRLIGRHIGRYRIERLIATGGMGTVYEAIQDQPRRTVAIKVLKGTIASSSSLRRFEYESQLLASLRHPGIAQVHEAGTHIGAGEKLPFFAMEYVPHASPITKYAHDEQLRTRDRLKLFCQVCDAVYHGHQKGIIHRDLKPGNILVGGDGQTKVIDFGVARATDSDVAVTTLRTNVGQLVGTVQYMSPEQCTACPGDLDTRSDVYALGVVLYELLSGRLPYDVGNVAVFEATRIVREGQPARLSTIDRALRGDIETIVLKALHKDRERRYQSVADLARDIRHYLAGEPIEVKRDRIGYVLQKTLKRHRALAVTGAAVVGVIAVLAVAMTMLYFRAAREQRRAESRELAARQHLYAAEMNLARRAWEDANMDRVKELLTNQQPVPDQVDLRGFEWRQLRRLCELNEWTARGHLKSVLDVQFSPDGKLVVSGGEDGTIRLWDAKSGAPRGVLSGHENAVQAVGCATHGALLASAGDDGIVRVWDVPQRKLKAKWGAHDDEITALAMSADGLLATAGPDRNVRIWKLPLGAAVSVLPRHPRWLRALAFSPDGSTLATGCSDGIIRLFDTRTWQQRTQLQDHVNGVYSLAYSPDGTLLASGGGHWNTEGELRLWDTAGGSLLRSDSGHRYGVWRVAFSPDGQLLATGSEDQMVKLWTVPELEHVVTIRGHGAYVYGVAFSPDGQDLVTASWDATIKLWDLRRVREPLSFAAEASGISAAVFSADGARALTVSYAGDIQRIDCATGHSIHQWHVPTEGGRIRALSSSSALLAIAAGADVELWSLDDRGLRGTLTCAGGDIASLALSADARVLACGFDGGIELFDVEEQRTIATFQARGRSIRTMAFSEDGGTLVAAAHDSTAFVWDVESGALCAELHGENPQIWNVAINAHGTLAATGGLAHDAVLWDTASGQPLHTLKGHQDHVTALGFSPNGRRLVTGGGPRDPTMRIWDVATGLEVGLLRSHTGSVVGLLFSPGGSTLLSFSEDQSLKLWRSSGSAVE